VSDFIAEIQGDSILEAEFDGNLPTHYDGSGKIVKDINFGTPEIILGSLVSGKVIEKTVVAITDAFDEGTEITIGTQAAQGILQAASDNIPTYENSSFGTFNNLYLTENMEFKAFISGTPTQGTGTVIIYYS
jgi:actin-like ATPase involved in cell morphogenesis